MSERERKYQHIYENLPVALLEEDYTGIYTAIRELQARGITDLRAYLTEHLGEVAQLASTIVVLGANRQAIRLFEADSKEELLVPVDRLLAPEGTSVFLEHIVALARGERSFVVESHGRTLRGKPMPLIVQIQILDIEDQTIGLVSCIDIAERKAIEARERAVRDELSRSNQELEQFAYIASHDLQEPLRMVASFAQLLERRYESVLDEKGRRYIGFIVDGARRMQALINDLLALSRVNTRASPSQPTDLGAVLQDVLTRIGMAIAESGAVITHDKLPIVLADASQIAQLFQNLLTNAIKFRSEAEPRVHVGARRDESWWTLSVRDNGIGIDPKHGDTIFAIFRRLHGRDKYPGTGIGLAIAQKIVQRHGGTIWVESEEGKGATFFFTLPALLEGERASTAA